MGTHVLRPLILLLFLPLFGCALLGTAGQVPEAHRLEGEALRQWYTQAEGLYEAALADVEVEWEKYAQEVLLDNLADPDVTDEDALEQYRQARIFTQANKAAARAKWGELAEHWALILKLHDAVAESVAWLEALKGLGE